MTRTPEPLWRITRDANDQDHWQPSKEMQFLLGCMLALKRDIESAVMLRPTLILLPADRVPLEALDGGTLFGLPFEVCATVAEMSLVYPVRPRARIQYMNGDLRKPDGMPAGLRDEVNRLTGSAALWVEQPMPTTEGA